jgi:hypothetical protein
MPVVATTEYAGSTQEMEGVVVEAMGATAGQGAGPLFRAGGPIPGGWRVVTGWESMEAYLAFFRDRLQPALATTGVSLTRLEVWHAHSIR